MENENKLRNMLKEMIRLNIKPNFAALGREYGCDYRTAKIKYYEEQNKEKGIEITDKSYNKLFINQKQFEKAYRITKVELLEKYDYEAYIQQKKTQDLGKETLEIQKDTPYIQQTEHAMNNQEQMLEQKNQDGVNID